MRNLKIIDRPIAFQRSLAGIAGGAMPGLFLSQCVYWHNRTTDPNGWFYKTQVEWEEETMLTKRQQETARQILRDKGYIEEVRQGNPARLYYRLNADKVMNDMELWSVKGDSAFLDGPEADEDLSGTKEPDCADNTASLEGQNSLSHNIHRLQTEYKETTGPVEFLITAEQFPEKLRLPSLIANFNRYWKYRKGRRLSLSEVALKREFKTLEQYDEIMANMAINRTIDRKWQKIWAFEEVDDIEPEYSEFLTAYKEFYKVQSKVYPPDPDYKGILALNKIIKYLRSIVTNGKPVEAWQILLSRYAAWDQFYQKQVKIEQIQNNLPNIILNIKNGNANNKTGGGAGVGSAENIARAFDKVDSYFGKPGQA